MAVNDGERLLALGAELLSEEVFVYAGPGLVDFMHLAMEVEQASQPGRRLRDDGAESPREATDRRELEVLARNVDLIKVPELIVGFKVANPDRTRQELARLEAYLRDVLADSPTAGTLKWVPVGDHDFLSVEIAGRVVPWRRLLQQRTSVDPERFEDILNTLEQLSVVLSVGLHGDYLLVSLGGSHQHLERLGQGESLADRPELRRLAAFSGERLTSVSFTSAALRAQMATRDGWFDRLVERLERFVPPSDIRAERRRERRHEREEPILPRRRDPGSFGPALAFSFISDRGYESYTYDWSTYPNLDGSTSLELFRHVGKKPLAAMVLNTRQSADRESLLAQRIQNLQRLAEEIAVPYLSAPWREQYHRWADFAISLGEDFRRTTRQVLLPALKGGELAFVLDASLTSPEWYRGMPRAQEPIPMFEPALVLAINDPEAIRQAMTDYRAIANDLVRKVREADPRAVPPDYQLPAPQSRPVEGGTVYWYPLPAATGVDPQLAPSGGLGERVAVLAISHDHAGRLLAETTPQLPLAAGQFDRPLVSVFWLDVAGIIDTVRPWVDLYGRQWIAQARAPAAGLPVARHVRRATGERPNPDEAAQLPVY